MPNNNCCIKDNEDACDHSGIPTSCDMDECTPKNINDSSKKSTFKDGKYICEPNSPPPTKRTCANPGEDVYTPNTFTQTPAPCCDGQKPQNDGTGAMRCPKTTPTKRTCANPGENIYTLSNETPAPCCDGQEPVNNICPNSPKPPSPPSPPENSGDNKTGLKVLLGILIFLWFVILGVFIYTKYKIGK
jgi:hypothetical protein